MGKVASKERNGTGIQSPSLSSVATYETVDNLSGVSLAQIAHLTMIK